MVARLLREFLTRIEARLDRIERLIIIQGRTTMSDLDHLKAAVAAQTTVNQSAVTLIQGLAAQIAAAGTDPAALSALTDQINANAQALSAAITVNTPAHAIAAVNDPAIVPAPAAVPAAAPAGVPAPAVTSPSLASTDATGLPPGGSTSGS